MMTTAERLHALLETRILLLDGAMGTMIQRRRLTESDFRGERFRNHPRELKGNGDLLVLTRPDVIGDIHRAYLEAGADIIETNTFSSTAIAQADYGLEALAYELNLEGARVAKAAADEWSEKTPGRATLRCRSDGTDEPHIVDFAGCEQSRVARSLVRPDARRLPDQTRGLIDGGADVLLIETIFDTLNAKAAVAAILDIFDERGAALPLMISATITDRSGRTLSGQTLDAFYVSIRHANPFSVGLNCALGAEQMRPYLADLARIAECYVTCYPNAGLPNAFGEYDELPPDTARLLRDFAQSGIRQHPGRLLWHDTGSHARGRGSNRRASAAPAGRLKPDTTNAERFTQFAGLETLTIRPDSNFIMIGERTNVTGSKRFARLITRRPVRRRRRRRPRPGPGRRQHPRHQHGRGDARLRGGHDDVPQRHCNRAGDRAPPVHDRQLEMVRHRSGSEVRAGKADCQLAEPEGR